MTFKKEPFLQRIEKPWGFEVVYTPPEITDKTGKILFTKAGKKWSFQYHDQKQETICCLMGKALIWLENDQGEIEKIPMVPMAGYTITPGQKHRVEAIEDSYMIETSMSERGTTVRLSDDYARADETDAMRAQENRGWKPPA
ncbi:MAG: cupin [Patescibacteria group bacterium]|nr:cupin [Patescibacteria group bacterium]